MMPSGITTCTAGRPLGFQLTASCCCSLLPGNCSVSSGPQHLHGL